MLNKSRHTLRRIGYDSHYFFALKTGTALLGAILPALFWPVTHESVILSLGVVAGAIGEPDDSLPGRVKNLIVTMIGFFIATFSVQLLYPYPWLFAIGLFVSSFGFIMLGALGPRYATISFGALLIAVYSMLGAEQATNLWFQPLWLCVGALWYGLISLIWLKIFPHKAVHEQLAQVFFALGQYATQKAMLFQQPASQVESIRQELARINIGCVRQMDIAKAMLNGRLNAGWDPHLERLLQLYLLAQDMHERIVSSHYRYEQLAAELEGQYMLSGFHTLVAQLGQQFRNLGYAVLLQHQFEADRQICWMTEALKDQLAYLQQQNPLPAALHTSLTFLQHNLANLLQLLIEATPLTVTLDAPVATRTDRQLTPQPSLSWQAIRQQLSLSSPLCRHALRIATCMVVGYGLLQGFGFRQGFWILLTCLFVCQSSFSATRSRIFQRIGGTLLGLLLTLPIAWLSLSIDIQLIGMMIAATLFFSQLRNNYSIAVTFITLYALTAFGLIGGQSLLLMWPRLLDTLLGAALSLGAVFLLWPDWQYRRLPPLLQRSVEHNRAYLRQVVRALQEQEQELDYRIARRQAHLADIALADAWQSMLVEPASQQRLLHICAALTRRSHTLIAYISTLGAHRHYLSEPLTTEQRQVIQEIDAVLEATMQTLSGHQPQVGTLTEANLQPLCMTHLPDGPSGQGLLVHELRLLADVANDLLRLSRLLPGSALSAWRRMLKSAPHLSQEKS